MSLATNLKSRMAAKGLSAARLAAAAGVTQPAISLWLSGQTRQPQPDKLAAAAKALDTTADALLSSGNGAAGPAKQKQAAKSARKKPLQAVKKPSIAVSPETRAVAVTLSAETVAALAHRIGHEVIDRFGEITHHFGDATINSLAGAIAGRLEAASLAGLMPAWERAEPPMTWERLSQSVAVMVRREMARAASAKAKEAA